MKTDPHAHDSAVYIEKSAAQEPPYFKYCLGHLDAANSRLLSLCERMDVLLQRLSPEKEEKENLARPTGS